MRRTLPLVARYADIWNAIALEPDAFRERTAALDELLQAAGRTPGAVRRTMMVLGIFGADPATLTERVRWYSRFAPDWAGQAVDAQIERWRKERLALIGTPAEVREQIAALGAAGVEELMVQWLDMDDLAGLEAFAAAVLPAA